MHMRINKAWQYIISIFWHLLQFNNCLNPTLAYIDLSRVNTALMQVDKKAEGGSTRFVVIDGPGRAHVRPAPDAMLRAVVQAHGGAG